jgi:hypothetical protein
MRALHLSSLMLSLCSLCSDKLGDNAPGLEDALDTDEQIIPEYSLSDCLTALELIQVSNSANGAFSAETEDNCAQLCLASLRT